MGEEQCMAILSRGVRDLLWIGYFRTGWKDDEPFNDWCRRQPQFDMTSQLTELVKNGEYEQFSLIYICLVQKVFGTSALDQNINLMIQIYQDIEREVAEINNGGERILFFLERVIMPSLPAIMYIEWPMLPTVGKYSPQMLRAICGLLSDSSDIADNLDENQVQQWYQTLEPLIYDFRTFVSELLTTGSFIDWRAAKFHAARQRGLLGKWDNGREDEKVATPKEIASFSERVALLEFEVASLERTNGQYKEEISQRDIEHDKEMATLNNKARRLEEEFWAKTTECECQKNIIMQNMNMVRELEASVENQVQNLQKEKNEQDIRVEQLLTSSDSERQRLVNEIEQMQLECNQSQQIIQQTRQELAESQKNLQKIINDEESNQFARQTLVNNMQQMHLEIEQVQQELLKSQQLRQLESNRSQQIIQQMQLESDQSQQIIQQMQLKFAQSQHTMEQMLYQVQQELVESQQRGHNLQNNEKSLQQEIIWERDRLLMEVEKLQRKAGALIWLKEAMIVAAEVSKSDKYRDKKLKLPTPPPNRACNEACNILELPYQACQHDIQGIFKISDTLCQKMFKKQLHIWHPDKWPQTEKQASEALFKIFQNLISSLNETLRNGASESKEWPIDASASKTWIDELAKLVISNKNIESTASEITALKEQNKEHEDRIREMSGENKKTKMELDETKSLLTEQSKQLHQKLAELEQSYSLLNQEIQREREDHLKQKKGLVELIATQKILEAQKLLELEKSYSLLNQEIQRDREDHLNILKEKKELEELIATQKILEAQKLLERETSYSLLNQEIQREREDHLEILKQKKELEELIALTEAKNSIVDQTNPTSEQCKDVDLAEHLSVTGGERSSQGIGAPDFQCAAEEAQSVTEGAEPTQLPCCSYTSFDLSLIGAITVYKFSPCCDADKNAENLDMDPRILGYFLVGGSKLPVLAELNSQEYLIGRISTEESHKSILRRSPIIGIGHIQLRVRYRLILNPDNPQNRQKLKEWILSKCRPPQFPLRSNLVTNSIVR